MLNEKALPNCFGWAFCYARATKPLIKYKPKSQRMKNEEVTKHLITSLAEDLAEIQRIKIRLLNKGKQLVSMGLSGDGMELTEVSLSLLQSTCDTLIMAIDPLVKECELLKEKSNALESIKKNGR